MIYGLRTCTSSDARSLDAACGRAALALPLGTFLPQFLMRAVTENLTEATSPAHTPTPWIIQGFDLWISAADGMTQICDLDTDYQKDYGRKLTKKERAANARLIAAAPKLLSALKGLSDDIGMAEDFEHQLDCQDPESCTLCIARKVIAEAEAQ